MGYNPQPFANQAQTRQVSPLAKRDIVQDGNTYTWEAEAFNSYAQVTKVKRSNSFQSAVEEQTDYLNDTVLWVLGLPTKVTNLTQGEVVDEYAYAGKDTLAQGGLVNPWGHPTPAVYDPETYYWENPPQ